MADEKNHKKEGLQQRMGKRRFWTSDRVIGYSGAALAVAAAYFPWYVIFNEEKFRLDITAQTLTRLLPDWSGRPVVSVSPSAVANRNPNDNLPDFENVITGAISDEDSKGNITAAFAEAQPFPFQPVDFQLLHVSQGKALIESETGVFIVAPGSVLPDQSKVAALEQRDGQWVIVTDKGDVYDARGKRQ